MSLVCLMHLYFGVLEASGLKFGVLEASGLEFGVLEAFVLWCA